MKLIISLVIITLTCILLSTTIFAISIDIDIKPSFISNEEIYFDYIISSDIGKAITVLTQVSCPSAPVSPYQIKTVNMKANEQYKGTHLDILIKDYIEPQTCTASILLIDPYTISEQKTFEIITNPSFSFDIELDKKIFVKNENIYLDYSSDVENIDITAILIYPNEKTQQLTLPTSIKAEQIGTYELEVTASKEGYKTINKKIQFGVIKSEANIGEAFYGRKIKFDKSYLTYLLIGIMVLFLSIIFLIIYLGSRRNKKKRLT